MINLLIAGYKEQAMASQMTQKIQEFGAFCFNFAPEYFFPPGRGFSD
jgi:hypothetical protein